MAQAKQTLGYEQAQSKSATLDSSAATLASAGATVVSHGGQPHATPGSTTGSSTVSRLVTVLPEVRAAEGQLELHPRDEARYEQHKLLGRGGMGEVQLANDHDIGRKVAIKRILGDASPHAVARLVDEVRTVGSLEHPNIVPIHDVGVDADGALFFVMKYVDGETLGSIIERLQAGDPEAHRIYNYERRLDLFVSLCRALQYAHSRGLVHRDVKPENIMVGTYGEVVLMDWGIVHRIRGQGLPPVPGSEAVPERAAHETVDGEVIGTPRYMSPEQARGEVAELDGRSDLYSAFVVLYELLTLRPYVNPDLAPLAAVCEAAERQPPSVFDIEIYSHPKQAEAVPTELRHYLRHGLEPKLAERFADVDEALLALEAVRAGDFAVECPVTFLKHNNTVMERFMDNRPTLSLAVAFTTGVLVLGGLAGWVAYFLR